jgi:hypothetical protein
MKCIYCDSEKIYGLGKCVRCYKRDKGREYRQRDAKHKPPKATECIKCGSTKIYVKSKCSKCYRYDFRQANLERCRQLDHLSKMRHKAKISEYNKEYAHRPQVVDHRKVRHKRIRQTPKYKKRMSGYIKKNWPRYRHVYRKAAAKYNRTDKSKLAHARFHDRHRERRNQERHEWGVRTEYNRYMQNQKFYDTLAGRLDRKRRLKEVLDFYG